MSEKKKIQVAWLAGGYHRRRAMLKQIRSKFIESDHFICEDETSFEFLLTEIQSIGCFNDNKIVVINEMPKFKDSNKAKYLKQFKEILSNLDDGIFIVFNGIDPVKEKSLFSYIQTIGKVYEYTDIIQKKDATGWVSDQLKKRGYSIDYNAAEALIEICGHDRSLGGIGADMLEMAIERLTKYLGSTSKQIPIEAVEASTFNHEEFIIWDVLNAVDDKNYDRCLALLSRVRLLDDNVTQAITQMLNMLLWKFRLLMFLKDTSSILKSNQSAVNAAMSMRKLKKNEGKNGLDATYFAETYASGENEGKPHVAWTKNVVDGAIFGFYGREPSLDKYSRRDIYRVTRAIQNAIIHLRDAISDNDAYLLADTVFMTACNVIEDANLKIIMDSFDRARL